jgi:histidinol-phosphate aminotransferase
MRPSVREQFQHGGYVYATRAEEIARAHGHTRIARLASNENPFPLSPLAMKKAEEALSSVHRYPPERHTTLIQALSDHFAWKHIILGNGMDGVIETIIRTILEPGDRVVIPQPTFSFYGVAARAQGATVTPCSRSKDFSVDIPALLQAMKGANFLFLCTPNNPTGTFTSPDDVRAILEGTDALVFLDTAYIEFADTGYQDLLGKYDTLIIGRTMSKAYSMAGLRLGYAFVPPWLEGPCHRAATPFSVNSVTAAAALGALSDPEHVQRIRDHVQRWRARFYDEIRYPTLLSQANFVLVDVAPRSGDRMMEDLAARGVMVRSCASFPGLEDHYIRVSIGEDWENNRFLSAINELG